MRLYEKLPHTELPTIRELPENPYNTDQAIGIRDEQLQTLKESVPLELLEQAVDVAEMEHMNKKLAMGIQPTGCGGSDGQEASRYAHTAEHALIAIMDYMAPTNEAGVGRTFVAGLAAIQPADPLEIAHTYRIQIAPPPSISIPNGVKITNKAIELLATQYTNTGTLDLKDIANQINSETQV